MCVCMCVMGWYVYVYGVMCGVTTRPAFGDRLMIRTLPNQPTSHGGSQPTSLGGATAPLPLRRQAALTRRRGLIPLGPRGTGEDQEPGTLKIHVEPTIHEFQAASALLGWRCPDTPRGGQRRKTAILGWSDFQAAEAPTSSAVWLALPRYSKRRAAP